MWPSADRRRGAGSWIDGDQGGKPHHLFEEDRRLQQLSLPSMRPDHLQAHRAALPPDPAWHGNGRHSHHGGCRGDQGAPEIVLELLAINPCGHPQLDIESRR